MNDLYKLSRENSDNTNAAMCDGPFTELYYIITLQGVATRDCRAKMKIEAFDEVIRFLNNEPLKTGI